MVTKLCKWCSFTHIRLTAVCSAAVTAHLRRLHRLSQGDGVWLVLFIYVLTIIVLWLAWLEITLKEKCLHQNTSKHLHSSVECFGTHKHRNYKRWEKNVERYRHAGTRLEHLKRVDNPLVVWAQQRANVLAWRVAKPLGHTSPTPFLTNHLESSFISHNLQQKSIISKKIHHLLKWFTFQGQKFQVLPLRGWKDQGCVAQCAGSSKTMLESPKTLRCGPNNSTSLWSQPKIRKMRDIVSILAGSIQQFQLFLNTFQLHRKKNTKQLTSNSLSLWMRGVKRKVSSSTENGGCQSCLRTKACYQTWKSLG